MINATQNGIIVLQIIDMFVPSKMCSLSSAKRVRLYCVALSVKVIQSVSSTNLFAFREPFLLNLQSLKG